MSARRHASDPVLWFALLAGIFAWLVHLAGGSALVPAACDRGEWILHALTAATAALTMLAMLVAWRRPSARNGEAVEARVAEPPVAAAAVAPRRGWVERIVELLASVVLSLFRWLLRRVPDVSRPARATPAWTPPADEPAAHDPEQRRSFLAFAGVAVNAASLALILLEGMPNFFLSPCTGGLAS